MQPRVDSGAVLSIEDVLDQKVQLRQLRRAIPSEYFAYIRIVVLEDMSLHQVKGCSGGANFNDTCAVLAQAWML